MSVRKMGVVASYVELFAIAISGFIYVPMLLSMLSTSEYGLYRLVGSVMIYFYFLDFGMSTIVTRFYVEMKVKGDIKKLENFLFIALVLCAVIAVSVSSLAAVFDWFLDDFFSSGLTAMEMDELHKIFGILVLNLFLLFWKNFVTAILAAYEHFVLLKLGSAMQVVLQQIVVYIVIHSIPSALAVVIVQTVITVCSIIFFLLFLLKKHHVIIRYHYWDWSLLRQIFGLSLSLFVITVANQIILQSGLMFIGAAMGTTAVAIYSVAVTLYTNYAPLADRITNVFLPRLTRAVAEKDYLSLNSYVRNVGRFQAVVLFGVLSAFFALGQRFIEIWAGASMSNAFLIALIIMIPLTIKSLLSMGTIVLQAMNKNGFMAFLYGAGAMVYLTVLPIVIQFRGGVGCAILTGGIIFLVDGIGMGIYYIRYIKLELLSMVKKVLPIFYVACFLGTTYKILEIEKWIDSIMMFAVVSTIYVVIYGLGIYFLILEKCEKEKICDFITAKIR